MTVIMAKFCGFCFKLAPKMISAKDISVIIPVAPGEVTLPRILGDLEDYLPLAQWILVGPQAPEFYRGKWVKSTLDYGQQLNEGAWAATRPFLWFLRPEVRLDEEVIDSLLAALTDQPAVLHYFVLRYLSDGPPLMWVNELGSWVRSQLMGVPVGNQGFCLSRENFEVVGGYPEAATYGEDHLFIWRARQKGIRFHCTGTVLKVSAYRYGETGWTRLTLRGTGRWARQAVPEYLKWITGWRWP